MLPLRTPDPVPFSLVFESLALGMKEKSWLLEDKAVFNKFCWSGVKERSGPKIVGLL